MLEIKNKILLFIILISAFSNLLLSQGKADSNEYKTNLPEMSIYNLNSNWLDQSKSEYKLIDLKGKVVVLTFIYTNCKFSCPITLAFLKKLESKLDKITTSKVMFVLVSMDPENDTPQKLKQFLVDNELNPNIWKLLTSDDEEIMELASTIGFKYKKVVNNDFAHSNIITLLDKDGVVKAQLEGLNDEFDEFKNSITNIAK